MKGMADMKLEHKCSLDWLKERQKYLTASEIRSLIPVTSTGKSRTITELDYLRVMANKMVTLDEEDCYSYGAAARGHLLEPYAVTALNETLADLQGAQHESFYWWDDEIVSRPERLIAFSPDAIDVRPYESEDIHAIAEIKSYGAEKHLVTAYTPKDKIEERWQIATAMALVDTIDHAYLVLFNPKMKYRKTFVIRYDRTDLESEIEQILDVEKRWKEFRETGPLTKKPYDGFVYSHHGGNESTIMKKIRYKHTLNPV